MAKTYAKLKAFLGLSPEATEAETDQALNERMEAAATDAGDTSETKEPPAEQEEATDAPPAEEDSQEAAKETAPAAGLTAEQVSDIVTAAVKPLVDRIDALESEDAADTTDGQREPTEVTDKEEPAYMANPVNRRAAKLFPAKTE